MERNCTTQPLRCYDNTHHCGGWHAAIPADHGTYFTHHGIRILLEYGHIEDFNNFEDIQETPDIQPWAAIAGDDMNTWRDHAAYRRNAIREAVNILEQEDDANELPSAENMTADIEMVYDRLETALMQDQPFSPRSILHNTFLAPAFTTPEEPVEMWLQDETRRPRNLFDRRDTPIQPSPPRLRRQLTMNENYHIGNLTPFFFPEEQDNN